MWKKLVVSGMLGVVALLNGCAHRQLRWNTTHQAKTLNEIYQQQVLDNLARFVYDSNSLPSFAYANAGAADVTDAGNIGSDTGWNPAGFSSEVLRLGASRNMKEAWTLSPVSDVRRLELMRCAYQISVQTTGLSSPTSNCPNCDRIMRTFYLGGPTEDYRTAQEKEAGMPDDLGTWTARNGRTTPACFQYVQWLACGDRKCVPKDRCIKRGHYCGTHVWVLPGGEDELAKLTLVILDYAISPQAIRAAPTKEVIWYFDQHGNPGSKLEASQEIKAVFPIGADVRLGNPKAQLPTDSKAPADPAEREQFDRNIFSEPFRDQPGYILPPIVPAPTPFNPLQFQMYQDFLTPWLR